MLLAMQDELAGHVRTAMSPSESSGCVADQSSVATLLLNRSTARHRRSARWSRATFSLGWIGVVGGNVWSSC